MPKQESLPQQNNGDGQPHEESADDLILRLLAEAEAKRDEQERQQRIASMKTLPKSPPPPPDRKKKIETVPVAQEAPVGGSVVEDFLRRVAKKEQAQGKKSSSEGSSQETVEDKLERLVEQFKDDIKNGKAAYGSRSLKIPKGKEYGGFTETREAEQYEMYTIDRLGARRTSPNEGPPPETVPFSHYLVPKYEYLKYGDVLVTLSPLTESKTVTRTITKEESGFFWGKKQVSTQVSERITKQKRLSDYGIKDGEDEALYSITIEFSTDPSQYNVKRSEAGAGNMLSLSMPESLARKLSKEITQDSEKLFAFLRSVDPKLMKLLPLRKTIPGEPPAMVYYELEAGQRLDPDKMPKPNKVVPRKVN